MISPTQLSEIYQQACDIEVQAFKPGNVSVYANGHDMTATDFLLSSKASAAPLSNPDYSLGEKIYYGVKATKEIVGCNTNLGIILLCAPMIETLLNPHKNKDFRQSLSCLLKTTTIDDANWVFKAISLASPGGLGDSEQSDVHGDAKITLTDAMKIAENRDRIALQYTNDFEDIFDFALLVYNKFVERWNDLNWAAVAVYVELLSKYPDSHIERKYGDQYTKMVQEDMALIGNVLLNSDKPWQHEDLLYKTDKKLKDSGINPGTTADLTVATIFAFLAQKLLV